MTGKPTTFKVTRMLQYLQKEILEATMLSKTAFQRKAIDVFSGRRPEDQSGI